MCVFSRGNTKGTNSSKTLSFVFICFVWICIGTDFVDFWEFVVWWLVRKWQGDRLKFVFSPDIILCRWLGSKYQLTNCFHVELLRVCCQLTSVLYHMHGMPPSNKQKRDMKTCTSTVTWQLAVQNATPRNAGKREGHWHASSRTDLCCSCLDLSSVHLHCNNFQ